MRAVQCFRLGSRQCYVGGQLQTEFGGLSGDAEEGQIIGSLDRQRQATVDLQDLHDLSASALDDAFQLCQYLAQRLRGIPTGV